VARDTFLVFSGDFPEFFGEYAEAVPGRLLTAEDRAGKLKINKPRR
jgi:hypothetical protein